MFIYIWTLHLADEIAFSSNNLLLPGPEAAAGHLGGLPGDVAEELLDGGDQGLFFLWEDLLKVHKREIFYGSDFEIFTFS